MRTTKYNHDINLRDDLSDIISDSLPSEEGEIGDAVIAFIESSNFSTLLDDLIIAIEDHAKTGITEMLR